jgi:hypothetical protein
MQPAEMLVRGLDLSPLPLSLTQLPPEGDFCALRGCGRSITHGYPVMSITTDATNEYMDTFQGNPTGFVCEPCGRLFRQDFNLGAWLIFEDGTAFHPLISRESALAANDPRRPCWSDLVRSIWPSRSGQNLVCLLTTNTKKRQWPRARVGPLGHSTPVYLHDGPDESTRLLDWPALLRALDLIEETYTLGWSKRAILVCLLSNAKLCADVGMPRALRMERALKDVRCLPEFTPALLIAQKSEIPS